MNIISFLEYAVLGLVALIGTAVVLTRDPVHQIIGVSFFGLVLALMFLILQAPDVALSQLVVGAVALPLMVVLALAKIRKDRSNEEREEHK